MTSAVCRNVRRLTADAIHPIRKAELPAVFLADRFRLKQTFKPTKPSLLYLMTAFAETGRSAKSVLVPLCGLIRPLPNDYESVGYARASAFRNTGLLQTFKKPFSIVRILNHILCFLFGQIKIKPKCLELFHLPFRFIDVPQVTECRN